MKTGQTIGILVILTLLLLGTTYVLGEDKDTKPSQNLASVVPLEDDREEDDSTVIVTTQVIHIVNYSEMGFSPRDLVISQGESVRFENSSQELMWVSHEESRGCADDRNEFDQCSPSSEFEYKFDEKGEWKYFNVLMPEHGGIIKVE